MSLQLAARESKNLAPVSSSLQIELISDTHNLVRPEALAALQGCDHVIHAGDICEPAVLKRLRTIAPLTVVRGNNDIGVWAAELPETAVLEAGELRMYVIHDLGQMRIDPRVEGFQVVVSGHSHRPLAEMRDGVLFVNPGSAGPQRFSLPVSVGRLVVKEGRVQAELVDLQRT